MNKIPREGVDIDTAFLAAAKRLSYSASRTKASILGSQEEINSHNPASLSSRIRIKEALRSIGQFGFRLAKPISLRQSKPKKAKEETSTDNTK